MLQTTNALRGRLCGLFTVSPVLLKKIGKPLETPDYKQAYLPYEVAPTPAEIERERRNFSSYPSSASNYERSVRVVDVPANLYTYGKEGMSVPIAIFKDQVDPVIGPEHTYPGIFENKVALRHAGVQEMLNMEAAGTLSPFQRDLLEERLDFQDRLQRLRMGVLKMRYHNRYAKDRAGGGTKAGMTGDAAAAATGKGKGAPAGKGGDPDKAAAAAPAGKPAAKPAGKK
jgi:hypothetical protein